MKKAKAPKKAAKKTAVKKKSHPILSGRGKVIKTRAKAKAGKKLKAGDKVTINFKVPPAEAKTIKAKADKLTNGNLTQMVRLSILAWKPAKKSLEGIRKTTRT